MTDLFATLKNAYEVSTHNDNRFAEILKSLKWDSTFYADGEYYFLKGEQTFTTPSLDPFNMPWKPSMMWNDGMILYFD